MNTLAFLGWLGWQEAVIVLVILLLLFSSRIPTVARGLGGALSEFRRGLSSHRNTP